MIDHEPFESLMPAFEPGTVWLVGAGPGDPALLTLAALVALRKADVIVYDALVGHGVLELAAPTAALEFAGKRGGKPSPRQRDITSRLIELARAGNRVLRLKGGDPFVFGRGGEEALALAVNGIRFRVVPGITSGLGGLAAAGIPATTRDTNHAVTLMTGHRAAGEEDEVDWAAFAKTGAALVLYMAMANLDGISEQLIAGGMAGNTAVAVITDATTPAQRVLVTELNRAASDVASSGMNAPAIIAIGSIVGLRDALAGQGIEVSSDALLSDRVAEDLDR
jgi:uroporphyrin-III C-methyltransferase